MDKEALQAMWLEALERETLLVPKHHPSGLGEPWKTYRTILTVDMADNLHGFISSGDFKTTLYQNLDKPVSPDYFVVESMTQQFSIPASGVPKFSLAPDEPKDRLVFVSGFDSGWHCFGESSAIIEERALGGRLIFVGPVV